MNDDIRRLEEKIAYLERHVAEQDRAMLAQAEEVARLRRDVTAFRALVSRGPGDPERADPADERPPHY